MADADVKARPRPRPATPAPRPRPEQAKKPVDPDFEPEIIVFACHYCAYAAADLAGSMRLQYPTTIRMIKLPCTGKLEVIHLLKAIEAGADGVYAAGCIEGECHYLKGNLWARKRVEPRQGAARRDGPRARARRDVQHVVGHGRQVRRGRHRVHRAHQAARAQPREARRRQTRTTPPARRWETNAMPAEEGTAR